MTASDPGLYGYFDVSGFGYLKVDYNETAGLAAGFSIAGWGVAPVLEAIDRVPTPWDMVKLYGRARERVAWRRPLVPAFGAPTSNASG